MKLHVLFIFLVMILFAFCSPKKSTTVSPLLSTTKGNTIDNGIYGWWMPENYYSSVYDLSDSIVYSDSIEYKVMLKDNGISNALLFFDKDSLHEYISYDTCSKYSSLPIEISGTIIHYRGIPKLVGSSITGHRLLDTLNLRGDELFITCIVFYDKKDGKPINKSVATVQLKRVSATIAKKGWSKNYCE